ncbi:MAG: L-serine ammonia-lyase [Phycisphaeraceae bacterium]|nr:L-serine ammonia-lyase [Phycisphaeraceae bacterium]
MSVFDIFKVGVGPSSSHTMGPWRATQRFIELCRREAGPGGLDAVQSVRADLFGSLSKTGKGHGTDIAVILALRGEDPVTCDTSLIEHTVRSIRERRMLMLGGCRLLAFDPAREIVFHNRSLPEHPNAMTLTARLSDGREVQRTYYSIGGGFVTEEGAGGGSSSGPVVEHPYPVGSGEQWLGHCGGLDLAAIVRANERVWRSDDEIDQGLLQIWSVMRECMHRGCHSAGVLPGGLNVSRRAAAMADRLLGGATYESIDAWFDAVRDSGASFRQVLKWVSCFALAVNEENASFGRVVTAPTNGAAGVIPAVMMYYDRFCQSTQRGLIDFMLVAGQVGSLFKQGATISAAMGGCQAEIGVSSAMAAAGLAHVLGASPEQSLMAAEIAMEHHLGMTCDPIGGLVQVPCIERNSMGAVKAITAANIAVDGDAKAARVSLDDVIRTMWATALDMNSKYKETAEGGLAVAIPVGVSEC